MQNLVLVSQKNTCAMQLMRRICPHPTDCWWGSLYEASALGETKKDGLFSMIVPIGLLRSFHETSSQYSHYQRIVKSVEKADLQIMRPNELLSRRIRLCVMTPYLPNADELISHLGLNSHTTLSSISIGIYSWVGMISSVTAEWEPAQYPFREIFSTTSWDRDLISS